MRNPPVPTGLPHRKPQPATVFFPHCLNRGSSQVFVVHACEVWETRAGKLCVSMVGCVPVDPAGKLGQFLGESSFFDGKWVRAKLTLSAKACPKLVLPVPGGTIRLLGQGDIYDGPPFALEASVEEASDGSLFLVAQAAIWWAAKGTGPRYRISCPSWASLAMPGTLCGRCICVA